MPLNLLSSTLPEWEIPYNEGFLPPALKLQSKMKRTYTQAVLQLPVDKITATELLAGVNGFYLVEFGEVTIYNEEKQTFVPARFRAADLFLVIGVKALLDSASLSGPIARFLNTLIAEVAKEFATHPEHYAVVDANGTRQFTTLMKTVWDIKDAMLASWADETPRSALSVIKWLEGYRRFSHATLEELDHLPPSKALLCHEVYTPLVYDAFNGSDFMINALSNWCSGLEVGLGWEEFTALKAKVEKRVGVASV